MKRNGKLRAWFAPPEGKIAGGISRVLGWAALASAFCIVLVWLMPLAGVRLRSWLAICTLLLPLLCGPCLAVWLGLRAGLWNRKKHLAAGVITLCVSLFFSLGVHCGAVMYQRMPPVPERFWENGGISYAVGGKEPNYIYDRYGAYNFVFCWKYEGQDFYGGSW